ncbi:MAG: glycosyltransferase [Methylomarinum sp.]|nr:glycosyltransferase [Methylomarinum sp.]
MREKNYSIAILLCTYNSEKFLAEQLDSISKQSYSNWNVWISDDGSQDNTIEVIESYKGAWGEDKLFVQLGPQQGFSLNFLSLVNNHLIQNDYYAYSDHDDVWQPNKLEQALKWLDTIPKDIPALYCGRTCLIDDNLKEIGSSPLFSRAPSFANAIVQNIGGGNTMIFNDVARNLLQKIDTSNGIISHDWLTYQVVTACGGKVFYDYSPTINYRQHTYNILGSNNHWRARIMRIKMLLQGTFRGWNASNLIAIQTLGSNIDEKSYTIIDHVHLLRSNSIRIRIKELMKLKIYRQTLMGNLGLVVAIIMRRF